MIGSKVMTQNANEMKKSSSFEEQSVFVSSIPSSMVLCNQINGEDFGKFCGLLRIYEF